MFWLDGVRETETEGLLLLTQSCPLMQSNLILKEQPHLQTIYGLSDRFSAFLEAAATRSGERARIMLELTRGQEKQNRSIRRRIASSLVQLGVKLDPLVTKDAA